MSQATDYTIDNSTGANVRSDINTVLGAIATNNSGGSDNGSIQALGFFANTSTSKLQLKNAAGNAFINLRGFDGTLPLPDGSASSPSLFFDDDTNTGVFSSAADNFDIATGGTVRFNINGSITKISDILDTTVVRRQVQNSSVHLAGGNNTNDGANIALYGSTHSSQANNIQFRASATNTMKLDSSGRLLIGTTSSREVGSFTSALQISGSTNNASSFSIVNNVNDANPALILLAKQRSGSVGGTTIVQDGDEVGAIRFIACDGSDIAHRVAQISCEIDGSPGTNDLPARLVFKTTPDTSTSALERMSIDNAGGVLIGVEANSTGTTAKAKLSIDCDDINAVGALGDASKYGLVFLNSPTTGESNGIGFFNDSGSTCGGAILHQDAGSGNIGHLIFYTSSTSDTPLERLRIDKSGNIMMGTTTEIGKFTVRGANSSGSAAYGVTNSGKASEGIDVGSATVGDGNFGGAISFGCGGNGRSGIAAVQTGSDDDRNGLVFLVHPSTAGTDNAHECARFMADGFLKAKGNAASYQNVGVGYHELVGDTAHDVVAKIQHKSSTGYGLQMLMNHANSSIYALAVRDYSSGNTDKAFIRADGDLENANNSYTGISDVKLKENVVDAKSQWDDIKALRVRNFNFKESTGHSTHKQLGLVAQEAELVCPSLVKSQPDLGENNENLGTETKVLKYSILYMKAVKALQEAQTRIEVLETKVAALESA